MKFIVLGVALITVLSAVAWNTYVHLVAPNRGGFHIGMDMQRAVTDYKPNGHSIFMTLYHMSGNSCQPVILVRRNFTATLSVKRQSETAAAVDLQLKPSDVTVVKKVKIKVPLRMDRLSKEHDNVIVCISSNHVNELTHTDCQDVQKYNCRHKIFLLCPICLKYATCSSSSSFPSLNLPLVEINDRSNLRFNNTYESSCEILKMHKSKLTNVIDVMMMLFFVKILLYNISKLQNSLDSVSGVICCNVGIKKLINNSPNSQAVLVANKLLFQIKYFFTSQCLIKSVGNLLFKRTYCTDICKYRNLSIDGRECYVYPVFDLSRLASFHNIPQMEHPVSCLELFEAGFRYPGQGNFIVCDFCKKHNLLKEVSASPSNAKFHNRNCVHIKDEDQPHDGPDQAASFSSISKGGSPHSSNPSLSVSDSQFQRSFVNTKSRSVLDTSSALRESSLNGGNKDNVSVTHDLDEPSPLVNNEILAQEQVAGSAASNINRVYMAPGSSSYNMEDFINSNEAGFEPSKMSMPYANRHVNSVSYQLSTTDSTDESLNRMDRQSIISLIESIHLNDSADQAFVGLPDETNHYSNRENRRESFNQWTSMHPLDPDHLSDRYYFTGPGYSVTCWWCKHIVHIPRTDQELAMLAVELSEGRPLPCLCFHNQKMLESHSQL